MQSKVLENVGALDCYMHSMQCAIEKAQNGSTVEDGYFLEKLEKTCNRMGFELTEVKPKKFTLQKIMLEGLHAYRIFSVCPNCGNIEYWQVDDLCETMHCYKCENSYDAGELKTD